MDDFEKSIKTEFITDAADLCSKITSIVDNVKGSDKISPDNIQVIFRYTHTLKGNSLAAGFEKLAQVFHLFESTIIQLRDGKISFDQKLQDICYKLLAQVDDALEVYRQDLEANVDFSKIIGELENYGKSDLKKDRVYKIAIIDDDADTREILLETLKLEFKAEFYEYGDAVHILKDIENIKFDLILTDFKMPILDGNTFIMKLRLTKNINSNTSIMFITGEQPEIISDDSITHDVYFIQKPFEFRRIIYYAKLSLFKA